MTTLDDGLINTAMSSLASFVEAKKALTAILTQYTSEFNSNASRDQLTSTLTAYVHQFDAMTVKSNELRKAVGKLNTVGLTAEDDSMAGFVKTHLSISFPATVSLASQSAAVGQPTFSKPRLRRTF